jgi:hypothetical protein
LIARIKGTTIHISSRYIDISNFHFQKVEILNKIRSDTSEMKQLKLKFFKYHRLRKTSQNNYVDVLAPLPHDRATDSSFHNYIVVANMAPFAIRWS